MRKNFNLKGSIVAIVTPFKSNGDIDYSAFEKLIDFHLENKTDGIVVCGTSGETVTLSEKEYSQIINFTAKKINKRIPLIAGSGSNSTTKVIEQSHIALENGAESLLIVSPYYNKPMAEGMYRHFAKIAENVNAPIILYNVPSRTAKDLPPSVALKLARNYENIVAVKEASGNLLQIMELIANRPEDLKIYSGDDALAVPIVFMGGDGCISVAANVIPKQFSEMIHYAMEGKIAEANAIHYKYLNLMNLNFIESNPIPVKTFLAMMGKMEEEFRLPLYKMENEQNRALLRKEIEILNLK